MYRNYILLKRKALLENMTLNSQADNHFLSKYQKLYKQSGKQIVFACTEIRKKKKLFTEDKRNICLVYISALQPSS